VSVVQEVLIYNTYVIEPTCSTFPKKEMYITLHISVNRHYPLPGKFCHPITREKNRMSLTCDISHLLDQGHRNYGCQSIGLLNEKIDTLNAI